LLILAALGVTEACVIDQSLFSNDYQGYQGWEQTRAATLIGPLGLSGFDAYNFIGGHVIFSFGAPLALAEAWRPERAHGPWLRPWVAVIVALLYVGAAILIASDPSSHSASPAQLIGSLSLIAALLAAATIVGVVGKRRNTDTDRAGPNRQHRLPLPLVLGVTLALALLAGAAPETWAGLALGLGASAVVGIGALIAARRTIWTVRHSAAVGLGFLLSRGLWAFTYFPLLGHVTAGPKYAHNVIMLLAVILAGWIALRPLDRPAIAPTGAAT
jgi:hypothetical protein